MKRATENTRMSAERDAQAEKECDNGRYCMRRNTATSSYIPITEKKSRKAYKLILNS
jgi:hypothetical protein